MGHLVRIGVSGALLAASAWAQSELHGTLIDAGCRDRSSLNLRRAPLQFTPAVPTQTPPDASGITVDAKTANSERDDVVIHQVPDLATRQADPTCAVTGGTRAYAVLMNDGKLLDLDEGGNTYAWEAIYATPQGRDMLNGRSFGFKPHVAVKGWIHDGKLFADAVRCM